MVINRVSSAALASAIFDLTHLGRGWGQKSSHIARGMGRELKDETE